MNRVNNFSQSLYSTVLVQIIIKSKHLGCANITNPNFLIKKHLGTWIGNFLSQ